MKLKNMKSKSLKGEKQDGRNKTDYTGFSKGEINPEDDRRTAAVYCKAGWDSETDSIQF